MNPAISIIVPVFNVEAYLEDCIESILDQKFSDFELILVNDGSTDESGSICDNYAKNDKRVKVVHKSNGGVSSARNTGINVAQGNYIGFVDSDDRIKENMYKRLYQLCLDTESDIAICKLGREIEGKIINKSEGSVIKELDNIQAMKQLFIGNLYRFSLCNKLFKKKCFDEIQFPEGRIHEDLSTTYRLFANADKTVYTNEIGYIYVKRENSILTTTFNENRLDAFEGWDEILAFMNNKYPSISNEFTTCFCYWCVDNIVYILKQVKDKENRKRYMKVIQLFLRKHKVNIKSVELPIKYKSIVSLMILNVELLILSDNFKSFKNKFS